MPDEQIEHEPDKSDAAYVPVLHVVHALDPETETVPTLQLAHDVEPKLELYVPAPQDEQLVDDDDPVTLEYVPAPQTTQLLDPLPVW